MIATFFFVCWQRQWCRLLSHNCHSNLFCFFNFTSLYISQFPCLSLSIKIPLLHSTMSRLLIWPTSLQMTHHKPEKRPQQKISNGQSHPQQSQGLLKRREKKMEVQRRPQGMEWTKEVSKSLCCLTTQMTTAFTSFLSLSRKMMQTWSPLLLHLMLSR